MDKQFLPFLTDDQGRSLDVTNGVVVTRSIPDPLDNSPDGWEENTIQFARNTEFRGIIKSYTTNLKFYLDGARILRNAYYRLGMETVLFFIWLKLDQSFGGGMRYKDWYKGEPDFGTFKDDWDGVSINITEGGFYKDLQANKGVVQEIAVDDRSVQLYIDGVNLRQKLNYSDLEDLEVSLNTYGQQFFGPYSLISQDGASTGFLINSEQLDSAPTVWGDKLVSDNIILQNIGAVPIIVTITGTIEFENTAMTSSPAYAVRFTYIRSNQLLADQLDYTIITTPAMVIGTIYRADFSIDIPLDPGERLYRLGTFFGGPGTDAVIKFTSNSKSSVHFITRQTPATIWAERAVVLGDKLSKKVSIGSSLSSPLLDTDFNLLVASGDQIRSIPDAVIKTSFSDWYKSIDAVKCAELDVVDNNPVVYDRYAKWDRTSVIYDLGSCNDWTLEPASGYIYDGVSIGYPAKQADSNIDVNGKYSFNNTFNWQLNITRRAAITYDAVSKYYADPYDIALIRVNMEGKDTTSGNNDNSNFFFDAEPKTDVSFTGTIHLYHTDNRIELVGDVTAITPFIAVGARLTINGQTWTITEIIDIDTLDVIFEVQEFIPADLDLVGTVTVTNLYQLRRPTFASISGIPDDGTVFNLNLTPRRILERHLRWLRSSFEHLDPYRLQLKTTEKNRDLVTVDGSGNVVDEDADILVVDMGERVFLPHFTTFTVPAPLNLKELIEGNNKGIFTYTMDGLPLDGFIEHAESVDATMATKEFKLLLSANNDLLPLINR